MLVPQGTDTLSKGKATVDILCKNYHYSVSEQSKVWSIGPFTRLVPTVSFLAKGNGPVRPTGRKGTKIVQEKKVVPGAVDEKTRVVPKMIGVKQRRDDMRTFQATTSSVGVDEFYSTHSGQSRRSLNTEQHDVISVLSRST